MNHISISPKDTVVFSVIAISPPRPAAISANIIRDCVALAAELVGVEPPVAPGQPPYVLLGLGKSVVLEFLPVLQFH